MNTGFTPTSPSQLHRRHAGSDRGYGRLLVHLLQRAQGQVPVRLAVLLCDASDLVWRHIPTNRHTSNLWIAGRPRRDGLHLVPLLLAAKAENSPVSLFDAGPPGLTNRLRTLTVTQFSEGSLSLRTRRPGFGLLSFSGPVVLRLEQSSEREYRSELLAPIVRLGHVTALEEFAVCCGRARNDIAGFIDERHP